MQLRTKSTTMQERPSRSGNGVALLASLSSIPTTAVDTIQTTVSAENEMTCCHDVFGKHLKYII